MSNKKQIEEMAKLACTVFDGNCSNCPFNFYPPCPPKASAERLFNAGFRKQIDGEWITDDLGNVCTKCGRTYDPDFDIKQRIIKQFKYCPNCGARMKGENR